MSGQMTPRPTPIKPGDSLEGKHVGLLFTSLSELRAARGGEAGYACNGLCICDGDDDCNNMFTDGVCGDAVCFEDGERVVCICVAV